VTLVIDEYRIRDSSLQEDVRETGSEVWPYNSLEAALYVFRLLLKGGVAVPKFDLIVIGLSEPDPSGRAHASAIARLTQFFELIRSDLPRLLLVLDGSISKELIGLAAEIGGTMITERRRDNVSEMMRGGQPEVSGKETLHLNFYGVHT